MVHSFSTFTAHFFTKNGQLWSCALATRPLDGRHTAEDIAGQFLSGMEEFMLINKVIAVVHDEAANMVASTHLLSDQALHLLIVTCSCHRLQTATQHCMEFSSVAALLTDCR